MVYLVIACDWSRGDIFGIHLLVKAKITKRSVDALGPNGVLWDVEVKGFGVKRLKDGGASYLVRYRGGSGRGAPIRTVTIGRHGSPWTAEKARKKALALLGKIEEGADPAGERAALREAPTVEDLAKRFRKEHAEAKRKERTSDEYGRLIDKLIIPELGKRKAAHVARGDIAKLHHSLSTTPYQANRVLAVCSKMFALAEAWGYRTDGSNPCRHIERFPEKKRERMLSREELSKLGKALREADARWALAQPLIEGIRAAREERSDATRTQEAKAKIVDFQSQLSELGELVSPQATAAIRLLLFTGARLSEILTLEWAAVDKDKCEARLLDSKTGPKTIHLAPPAMEALAAVKQIEKNPYVITGQRQGAHLVNLEKPWRIIREAAGLDGLRLHDLRHAYASVGASSGLGLPIIGKLLGHQNQATTQRYAHIANDPAKAAAAVISEIIAASMQGEE